MKRIKTEEYVEMEPVFIFPGWVGTCLGPEPTKKGAGKKRKKTPKEPFGFYPRSQRKQ